MLMGLFFLKHYLIAVSFTSYTTRKPATTIQVLAVEKLLYQ